jgi:energy-coupling factor transporter ATP-binding protein EcfA2
LVKIFGENIEKKTIAEISKKVGYIFQNPDQQIFANSVKEEVEFGPRNLNLSEKEISFRCTKALEIVGLSKFLDVSPFSLSKGQKQGLAVASVLAMEPKILVMDEPTTGRDYLQSIQIMEIIKKMNQSGTTVIFITHNMQLVAKYAKRVIVMKKGKIILDGSPKCVFKQKKLLSQTYLKPPQITALSMELWNTDNIPLSINEFVTEFVKQKESAKK